MVLNPHAWHAANQATAYNRCSGVEGFPGQWWPWTPASPHPVWTHTKNGFCLKCPFSFFHIISIDDAGDGNLGKQRLLRTIPCRNLLLNVQHTGIMPFVQTIRNVFHLAAVFPVNDKTLKPELKIILFAVPVQEISISQVLFLFFTDCYSQYSTRQVLTL